MYAPAVRRELEAALESGMASLAGTVEAASELVTGEPAAVLAGHGFGVDLLVVGSREYGPLRRTLVGGVSAALTRSAPCPVIVVPRGAGARRDEPTEAHTQRALAAGGGS